MEDNANKETRDLEDEFIKTYEHLPELWNPDHAHYTNKHKRNAAHDVLLQVLRKWDPEATRYSVRKKINVLRSCYRKVLHKYLASRTIGPDGEEIYEYEPKYSKFHMLRFLDDKLHLQPNNTVEINNDDNYYEDDDGLANDNNDNSFHTRDVLALEDNKNHVNKCKVKRLKVEQLYPVNAEVLDRELEAIGANVACKLKRMDPEQRIMEDNANKETRDLEDEFIKTYEHLPELWNPDHAHYTNKHKRNAAHDVLLQVLRKWDPEATRYSVRKKINVLRSCYRKVLHKYLASRTIGPDGEEIYEYEPKYSKFHMLRFLDDKLHLQPNNTVEINIDDNYYEDDDGLANENNDNSFHKRDVLALEDDNNHIVINQDHVNEHEVKRLKVEQLDPDNAEVLDRELVAIGANVACKLKRMDPEQRYHAELLINKVLITGLRNNLTEGTDFTEVNKK